MHLFFEFGDQNFIAFFDLPHTVEEEKFPIRDGLEEFHVAMEVGSREELTAFKRRLEEHGVAVFGPIDHHFCHSIYFFDPNGLNLEFTVRDDRHDAILAEEAANGPRVMGEWISRTAAVRAARLAGAKRERDEKEVLKSKIAEAANEGIAKAGRASGDPGEVRT